MKLKKWKLLTVLLAVLMLATAATMTVYAYFSTRVYVYTNDGNTELAHLGMNLQLLFGKLDSVENDGDDDYVAKYTELNIPYYSVEGGFNVYHTGATGDCPKFDPEEDWGSPQNPYIIANERHLQNLSALQSVGYFDLMYIEKNFTASGSGDNVTYTYNNGVSMPYFLVCTEAGTPVVIDATKIGTIRPIGSAEHPFIGVIGGAPISGSTFIDTNANKTQDTGEKTTTVSTLHNVKVQTTTDQTDVGLFGYVGYLGTEPISEVDGELTVTDTKFAGATSVIQNLLLSDCQVIVKNPSPGEALSKLFKSVWELVFSSSNNHRFTYTNLPGTPPKEDHHIGILAGHVSYGDLVNISVYYSDNSIYAIDVTHTNKNYHSASGILGYMYNMNAVIANVQTDGAFSGNCIVQMGTGTSSEDVEIPSAGAGSGTGGGALSGNGRGYVTAAEIFSKYNNVNTNYTNNEILWRYKPQGGTWVENAILIYKNADNNYTLADGKTSVTSISASSVTAGGYTWSKFFVRSGSGTSDDPFAYKTYDGTLISDYELVGNNINGKAVWRYEAGGDAIWHYGIRVNFDGTNYTIDDCKTAATVIAPTVSAPAKVTATIGETPTTWEDFFVVDTRTNSAYIYDNLTATTVAVTSFNRKPMDLIDGKTVDGAALCTQWMRDRLLGIFGAEPEPSGLYYFTDGVFTFALSSDEDTIRDTWENDKAPTLHLGEKDPNKWEIDPATGNKAVVALLTPVTNNAALDAAITANKQIYISAQPTSSSDAFLMSLVNNDNGTSPAAIKGTMLNLGNDLRTQMYESYASGLYTNLPTVPHTGAGDTPMDVTLATLQTQAFWNQYTLLNIGRTSNTVSLETLRTQYNIAATKQSATYYFRNDTGVRVTPTTSAGTIPEYYTWDGFFYYTVESYDGRYGSTNYEVNMYYQPANNGDAVQIGETYELSQGGIFVDGSVFDHSNISYFIGTGDNQITFATAYNATGNEGGEDLYTYTYTNSTGNSVTVSAPLLYMNDSKFVRRSGTYRITYALNTIAYVNGSIAAKDIGSKLNYYVWDAATNKFFQYDEKTEMTASAAIAEDAKADTDTTKLYRINKYPSYSFTNNYSTSATASYLQLLCEYTTNTLDNLSGAKYSIWAGTDTQYGNLSMGQARGKNGVLVFDGGHCYIRYILDSTAQYVKYNYSESTQSFSGSVNRGTDTQLYIYIIEGIVDMDYGVNTYVPKEDSTYVDLSGDAVVLWPQTTLKQNGVYANNGPTTTPTQVAGKTDTARLAQTEDPTYSVIPLTGTGGLNWGTKDGYILGTPGTYGLHQKFQMADQAGFGTMYNILGGNWEPGGSDGYTMLVAPIGSNGVEATIPKGCVAFRVNSGGTNTVRIIVAVPTTDKYISEDGFELDLLSDYYIGVWNVAAANEGTTFEFNKADALEKFELPRSYTFSTDDMPADVESVSGTAVYKNYVNVSYQGTEYRTYLNGGCYLVAYEFTVVGEGVYIIGSAHGTDNAGTKDVPMEIVHFSVSNTASAGRDGVSGSKLGTVDFVYDDTKGTIVTINMVGVTGGVTNGGSEDYAGYYASQCLLHTDNSVKADETNYVLINDIRISIRRFIDIPDPTGSPNVGEATIQCIIGPPASTQKSCILVDQYTINADVVIKEQESATP